MREVTAATSVWARRLALAGIVGPIAFALAAVVGGTVYEEYSHVDQFASELAASGSEARLVMTIGFVVLGACTLAVAWSLRVLWPAATALAAIVALAGVSTLTAGAFSCDVGCPTEGARSLSQQLHDVASVATFLLWIAMALAAAWRFRGTAYGRASALLGAVQVGAAVVLGSSTDRAPGDPVGLVQRIFLVAVGVWFVLTTLALRASVGSASSS